MTIELIETRDQLQVLEDSTELIELITQGEQGVGITEGSKGIITIPSNLTDWTLNDNVITSAKIVNGTIVNEDINDNAAIALTKLATGALPTAITVTSANISDLSIVDADISGSAAISLSKLATGALPTGITVTSANISDLSIVNADINASAAIAGTKISPNFGSQNIETTGNATVSRLKIEGANIPKIEFTDADDNPDYSINVNSGQFNIIDATNSANRFRINTNGHIDIAGNLDVGAGLDVTGQITATDNLTITSVAPKIFLVDSDTNDDFSINGDGGTFRIKSETDSANRFVINSDGHTDIIGRLDAQAGIDVTGNISVSGTVDGRDVATDGTKLDGIETGATADQTAAEIKTLLNSNGIVNAQIDASAAIAGSKINPNFGSQALIGSELVLSATQPNIRFTDVDGNPDYLVKVNTGVFDIRDFTSDTSRLSIQSDGHVDIAGNLDVGAGLDVTGNISVSGTVDGRDVASDGTKLDGIESNATADQTASEILSLLSDQNITTTGTITSTGNQINVEGQSPTIDFNDTNNNSDFRIKNNDGKLKIQDKTNGNAIRLSVDSSGTVDVVGNLDVGAGLDVTGNITVTGTVDGVDIAALNTTVGNLSLSGSVLADGTTATTQSAGDNSTKVATTAYADTAVSNLVDSAPSALNTLNELAAALGDDANFSTTVTNSIATKLPLAGGTLTGDLQLTSASLIASNNGNQGTQGGTGLVLTHGTTTNLRANHFIVDDFPSGKGTYFIQTTESGVSNDRNMCLQGYGGKLKVGGQGNAPTELLDVAGNIAVSGTVDGRDLATDGSKLDGIEVSATADQTSSEIVALVADQTIAPSEIDMEDNKKIKLGTGDDLEIFYDGTHSRIDDTGTGDLRIRSDKLQLQNPTGEEYFVGNSNGSVELYFDDSKKFETISAGVKSFGDFSFRNNSDVEKIVFDNSADHLKFSDNIKAKFGSSSDLQIFHDGSHSYIQEKTATSDLIIKSKYVKLQGYNDENMLVGTQNTSVELYYNNVKKLETTSTGIETHGNITTHDLLPDANAYRNIGTSSNKWNMVHATTLYGDGSNLTGITASADVVSDTSPQLGGDLQSNGNDINFADNDKAIFGTGSDLQIYHNGSNSFIDESSGTGRLIVRSSGLDIKTESSAETMALFNKDGAVELYYDNSKKLNTQSWGVEIVGALSATNIAATSSTSTFGTLQIPSDSTKLQIGAGQDLELYHNGSSSYIVNNTGDTHLIGAATDSVSKWLYIQAKSGEHSIICKDNAAVELYYDNTVKLGTTSYGVSVVGDLATTGHIQIPDNYRLKVGNATNGDLILLHDGTNSIIDNATGDLYIRGAYVKLQGSNGENMLVGNQNTSTELYYDNVKQLETTSNGIEINSSGSGNGEIRINGSTGATEGIVFERGGTEASRISHSNSADLAFSMGSGVSTKLKITSGGNIQIPNDSGKLQLGASQDLQIYHDGSHSYIQDTGTGELRFTSNTYKFYNAAFSETLIEAFEDGAVNLYYNNSKKLETTSTGITVTGSLTVTDDITLQDDLLMGDQDTIKLGDSLDLTIQHDGTDSSIKNLSGETRIQCANIFKVTNYQNTETYIKGSLNGSVELYHDNSLKLDTRSGGVGISGDLFFVDSSRIYMGSSNDFQLFHDGTNTHIVNATGNLVYRSDTHHFKDKDNGDTHAKFVHDGAVELYHNNSIKLNTNAAGIRFYGSLRGIDNEKLELGTSQDLKLFHNGSHSVISSSTGSLRHQANTNYFADAALSEIQAQFIQNGKCELRFDNAVKFETTSDGATFSGSPLLPDNVRLKIGGDASNPDLQIYHDGTNTRIIEEGTGELYLDTSSFRIRNSNGSENVAKFISDGAVELYHNNSKKFETKSSGVEVSGRLSINEGGQLINESGLSVTSSGNTAAIKAEGHHTHNPLMTWNNATSGTRQQIQFGDGSSYGSRGSITTNGANVTYGGTSDYRKKQDDVLITNGIEKIKLLKPKRFKWKDALDLGLCDGFFAHEVQEVIPTSQAVIGTKDEVDSDNNPVYQQIDQSKLVPLLTAALQEAIAKIEVLETKVAALEAA